MAKKPHTTARKFGELLIEVVIFVGALMLYQHVNQWLGYLLMIVSLGGYIARFNWQAIKRDRFSQWDCINWLLALLIVAIVFTPKFFTGARQIAVGVLVLIIEAIIIRVLYVHHQNEDD